MRSGELAALVTAAAWTGSSLAFEAAARRIGSLSLNLVRVVMALAWLTLAAAVLRGQALPTDASPTQWGYLAASGVVGLVLGDLCTFRAYVVMGARRTMVASTATPIFTAILAAVFLGEGTSGMEAIGMALIVGGLVLAVRERGDDAGARAQLGRGVVLALGGALGQAGGLILSRRGVGDYSALAGTQIRMVAGVVGFLVVMTATGWWSRVAAATRDRRAMGWSAIGALLGPAIGVTCSLYAVSHASAGVAAALMSLSPVLVIPIVVARGESVGARGVVGAVVAVAGTVWLALT